MSHHKARLMVGVGGAAALAYLWWLLQPARVGFLPLFALLVVAELFNVTQALGFWWTCARRRAPRPLPPHDPTVTVDVFIPVYNEPVEVVEPTVAAAVGLRGADVRVALLDDGDNPGMEALAARHGIRYLTRSEHDGAKAGNINHALGKTTAEYVLVLDCDHVPFPHFLEQTLGHFTDPDVAFVQTPQYYANADDTGTAGASWSQQALFFGPIAQGKDAHGAMFCCGTNVVFRRDALDAIGGFPEQSLTEDFELSIELHEQGWRSVYVHEVLAAGLGPEDMASYVSQQHRWARGCLSAIPRVVRSRLPLRLKAHYLLSSMFFLSGWTFAIYMSLPLIRILTGAQPVAGATADQFLLFFGPYFGLALLTLAVLGGGRYRFDAYALAFASFWIHVHASIKTVLGRPGRFVVTPKQGDTGPQPSTVLPALIAAAALTTVALVGLASSRSPATLNNVAFATLHVTVLLAGARHALVRRTAAVATERDEPGGMSRRVAAVLLSVGLAVTACGDGDTAEPPSPEARNGPAPRATDRDVEPVPDDHRPLEDQARDAGRRFLDTYVAPHGRVVRHDQGGDTVSEGQAYAMLVAAALGDEDTFASVWAWTKDHLLRSDGLLAWRWHDGEVVDWQVAADADLDAAHALFLAAARFDDDAYRDDAQAITDALFQHLTVPLGAGRLLVAGPWARDDQVWNPSYLSPLAFSVLYRVGDDPRWAEVASTARVLLDRLTAEPPHLAPDWARLTDHGPVPHGEAPAHGYDAVRTPWRFALDCDAHGVTLAARTWPLLSRLTADGTRVPPAVLTLDGSPETDDGHPAATVGAAASASAAGATDAADRLLSLAESQDEARPTYFGSALVALGRLGLDTDLLGACP